MPVCAFAGGKGNGTAPTSIACIDGIGGGEFVENGVRVWLFMYIYRNSRLRMLLFFRGRQERERDLAGTCYGGRRDMWWVLFWELVYCMNFNYQQLFAIYIAFNQASKNICKATKFSVRKSEQAANHSNLIQRIYKWKSPQDRDLYKAPSFHINLYSLRYTTDRNVSL